MRVRGQIAACCLCLAACLARAEPVPPPDKVQVAFSPRGDGLETILDELHAADERVDVAMFYLSNHRLIDALCYLSARRQVRLTVYVDEAMASAAHRATLNRLQRYGAAIWVESLEGRGKLHLKTLVIDGDRVVTGSSNWTETAFDANCEDTVVLASAPLAARYLARFDGLRAHSEPYQGETYEADDLPEHFPSAPDYARNRKDDRLVAPRAAAFYDVRAADCFLTPGREGMDRLIEAVGRAARRIDVGIYSVSDPEVIEALCGAARTRGVTVRMLVDDTMLGGSGLRHLQVLYQAGVKLSYVEKASASLHLKCAVIDEHQVFFGSHNWTPSAAERNLEDLIVLDSRRMARHYIDYFDYIARDHATPFEAIARDRVAATDDGAAVVAGLRKPGGVAYPDTLPRTGPRRHFDDIFAKHPTQPFRVHASVEYLDDEQYLPVLLDLIRTANQSILVSLYHAAPTGRAERIGKILDALGDAAERGRYVYLVLNTPENPSDSQQAYHSDIAEQLRARGVDVRLCVPAVQLHEKVVVVDLAKVLIGSHNWSEGAVTGAGVYESSALLVLPRQDPRFGDHILRHPVIGDMRDRERWENELALLRHIASLPKSARAGYIRKLEAER